MIDDATMGELVEAWDKGLITRDEFRSFIGLHTRTVPMPGTSAPNGLQQPYGIMINPAVQFGGFATDDNRDKGY